MTHTLILSAILFATGLVTVIIKRNAIMVLIGIELMLNAANLNLIVFSRNNPSLSGQFLALFVIVVAVCEAAVGLAIVLRVYKYYQTSVPDQVHELKD
ncbi:MAG TPA: NADH-quinone oxidoreductase subunit NuoK [Cyclobacteriaceae bacterium]|nr:NADH-quinone oxidoreductase subunit NuoK [Cyclobacteriaceae bacterium]HMV08348.1 NADH-quinone oxidoreductase subunit NuoK [Cyclobacteriaceae bacterium]HMV88375.1 NADH-quinone oxidoreductase subunit NuoK [Cyclobacteriaceae bacterium]HMX02191.1 NADH-quinone oxidoreductase subunit NuoK [Cyclobacteriaceae bacterium]HMX49833.1 NADH-quinone oxidoreductase subunit NuoK [Cyclobacteriaceae bacterium]